MIKPIIFSGDSFTFGEGLELYDERFRNHVKNLNQLPTNQDEYNNNPDYYHYNWARFQNTSWGGTANITRNKLRFATLIAEGLDTFYFSPGENGYNQNSALSFIEELLKVNDYNNFSYIIMNLTSLARTDFKEAKKEINKQLGINIPHHDINCQLPPFLLNWHTWIYKYDTKRFIDFENEYNELFDTSFIDVQTAQKIQDEYSNYENFEKELHRITYYHIIDRLEKTKIPYYLIGHWSKIDNHILNKLKEDSIIKEKIINKIIPIKINDKEYQLAELYDKPLWLYNDFKWAENAHPSAELHKLISTSVKNFIQNLVV